MQSSRSKNTHGFTLLEILVALFIFAIVGLVSAQLLSRTVDSYGVLEKRGERLAQIHRAMQLVERDVLQFRNRSVRIDQNQRMDPLMVGVDGTMALTRGGWRNPLQRPRSELQRVGYRLQGTDLVRAYWPAVDRPESDEPITQVILERVDDLEFFAIDQYGEEHKFWPTPQTSNSTSIIAVGVILRISMAPIGIVERVWELPNA